MVGIYYVQAADWLRAVGVKVVEIDDWETRARSSGGFAAPPLGVQWHHTASSGQHPLNDIRYMTQVNPARPVGNCYLATDGTCYMLAAGAANTAGKGGPYQMSRGTVPLDKGNTTTWAIEAANNGVGQAWPQVQVDAYFKISNEMNRRFGNQPTDLFTHNAYTPGRKIDPATASAVHGPWKPRSVNSSQSWSVADVKAEATRRAGTKPPTTPTTPTPTPPLSPIEGDDDMILMMRQGGTASANWGGWASLNGGATMRSVTGPQADAMFKGGNTYDGKTLAKVTTWSQVTWTASTADLDKYLNQAG